MHHIRVWAERKGSSSNTSLTLTTGSEDTLAAGGSMKRKSQQSGSLADGLSTVLTSSGSLPRRGSMERRSFQEKRRSWSAAEFASCLDSFRPVTLTVSSFFKQVRRCSLQGRSSSALTCRVHSPSR